MTRHVTAIAVGAVVVLALLVAVGRWEQRHAARTEMAGMRSVLAAVGGDPISRSISGYRFGPPDCLAYHDKVMALALQLCFDAEGRLIQAVDRRPAEPRYYSLEYKPSLSTIRFPRHEINQLLEVAVKGSG